MAKITAAMKDELGKIGRVALAGQWEFAGLRNIELKRGGFLDLYEFQATKSNPDYDALKEEPIGLFERDVCVEGDSANGFTFLASKTALANAVSRAKDRIAASREAGEATR
jgi:hypothetical protein